MIDQKNNEKVGQFKFIYFVFLLNILIIGYATTELMTFSIEDAFNQPVVYGLFNLWGPEFAKSMAWLSLSSLVVIPLAWIQKKLSIKQPDLYRLNYRHQLLNIIGVIGLITAFIYILMITYSYFSGRSDPIGLYRAVATLGMIAAGIIFVWGEKTLSPRLNMASYLAAFLIFLLGCGVTGSTLTFTYASPSKMRKVYADLNKMDVLEKFTLLVKNYFAAHGTLPKTKDIMIQEGQNTQLHDFYKEIRYEITDHTTFKLCATFETDSTDARRMMRLRNRFYKAGEHCLVLSLSKQKSDTIVTVVNNNNIKISVP